MAGIAQESGEPHPPDVLVWTTARLLALSGEHGAADRLAAGLLSEPSGKWVPPWLLVGHKPRITHELDPVPIVRRRSFFSPEKRNLKKLASSAKC